MLHFLGHPVASNSLVCCQQAISRGEGESAMDVRQQTGLLTLECVSELKVEAQVFQESI